MATNNFQISKVEMMITVVSMIIGVGILTLPRGLASAVGTTDGWISIIIGAVLNMFLIFMIVRLHRNFPGNTLLHFLGDKGLGKVCKIIFSFLFLIYFVCLLSYEARMLTIVAKIYLLDQSPSEIIAAIIFIATTYATTKGVQGIIHLNLMFFPIIISIIVILLVFNVGEADLMAIFPIASEGIGPIFMGVKETTLAFLGIEILFFFLAYVKMTDLKALPLNIGIGLIAFLYLAIAVLCYMVIGIEVTEIVTFPLVALAKEVEIVRGVVERIEPFMIAVWMMTIFNTMAILQFLSTRIVKDEFFKKWRISTIAICLTFVSFIITFIPKSIQETFQFGDYVSYVGFTLTCLSLFIGYLFVLARKKVSNEKSEVM